MRNAKRICIFLYGMLCAVTLGALSLELYRDNMPPKTVAKEKQAEVIPTENIKQYKFVVVDEANHLVVYYVNRDIRYLATDIPVERLPEELRRKVKDGINFSDEKALYDFLENYSS